MKLIFNILIILIFLIVGCKSTTPDYEKYVLASDSSSFILGVNRTMNGYFYPKISVFENNDTSFLYYLSKEDTSLRCFQPDKKEQTIVRLSNIFSNRINYSIKEGCYVFFETDDLFWIDSPSDDSLYQGSINELVIKSVRKVINNETYLLDLVEPATNSNHTLLLGIYGETDATYGIFNVEENSLELQKVVGKRPYDYSVKDMYVESGMISRVNQDSFLISYYFSDSVDLYVNNKFEKRLIMKSDSSLTFTGFEGDKTDINAI